MVYWIILLEKFHGLYVGYTQQNKICITNFCSLAWSFFQLNLSWFACLFFLIKKGTKKSRKKYTVSPPFVSCGYRHQITIVIKHKSKGNCSLCQPQIHATTGPHFFPANAFLFNIMFMQITNKQCFIRPILKLWCHSPIVEQNGSIKIANLLENYKK